MLLIGKEELIRRSQYIDPKTFRKVVIGEFIFFLSFISIALLFMVFDVLHSVMIFYQAAAVVGVIFFIGFFFYPGYIELFMISGRLAEPDGMTVGKRRNVNIALLFSLLILLGGGYLLKYQLPRIYQDIFWVGGAGVFLTGIFHVMGHIYPIYHQKMFGGSNPWR